MANVQMESLAAAGALATTQYMEVSQGGQTKKTLISLLITLWRTVLDLVYMPYAALTTAGYFLRINAAGTGIEWSNIPPPRPAVTKTTSYTLVVGTDYFVFLTPAGNITITLPTAVGNAGVEFVLKRTNATGVVTLNTTGGQTIDGSASGALSMLATANLMIRFVSDGANWYRLDKTASA